MDTTTNFLFFNSRDELLRLDISKIVYFESDGNYTNIILTNKHAALPVSANGSSLI